MSSLNKVQRAGILKRLRQNKRYWAIIFYSGTGVEDITNAQGFAAVLLEAGWRVAGPEANERIYSTWRAHRHER
jgi:hypothetical protein